MFVIRGNQGEKVFDTTWDVTVPFTGEKELLFKTRDEAQEELDRLKKAFPPAKKYKIVELE